jgi:UDP-glucose 4-epimerase
MRVLVTGGAGFIGSHVVEFLVRGGHEVVVVDNLESGHLQNLASVKDQIAIETLDLGDWLQRQSHCNFDSVVHLAAVPSVQKSIESPVATHRSNYELSLLICEFMKGSNAHLVFASSAATYGKEDSVPISELAKTSPISLYGADKLASEYAFGVYQEIYGLNSYAFRFFNIYGPRQDPSSPYSGVLSIFINRVSSDSPITVYGDGNQTRDFVHVTDVAKVIGFAVENRPSGNLVMNLATGREVSLNEVLGILKSKSGKEVATSYTEARAGDIVRSCGNPSRLLELLGANWSPTPIEDGLSDLLTEVQRAEPSLVETQ